MQGIKVKVPKIESNQLQHNHPLGNSKRNVTFQVLEKVGRVFDLFHLRK